ncbi:MAG: hypothetical protein P8Y44_14015, partial [Acidobacteriota bacterium]
DALTLLASQPWIESAQRQVAPDDCDPGSPVSDAMCILVPEPWIDPAATMCRGTEIEQCRSGVVE